MSPLNRLHKAFPVLVTTCCLGLLGGQWGCGDADTSDAQVREHIAEGEQAREAAVTSAPSVPEGYRKAAAVADASPAAKVEALTVLAEAERARAVALLTEADRLESELLRLVGAVNRQASRIQSNNTLAAGLAKLEPAKVQQVIEQQRSAAQGEQDPVWVEHETGALQAIKGLEAHAAQLQEQIGQLEGQSKDLADQRKKQIADAEKLEAQSEQVKGQESVDLFNQSANVRKQAADLGVQIEALEAKLAPLRQDLERTASNQQVIAAAVENFGKQLEATQQGWQAVQQQIAAIQALSAQILNGTGNEPAPAAPSQPPAEAGDGAAPRPVTPAPMASSIVGKLRQVATLAQEIEARRTEAENLLKSALDHYTQAGAAAANLTRDLSTRMSDGGNSQRPERATWQQMMDLHNPSRFKLKQATMQVLLADLYRSRAAELATLQDMTQLLTAALQGAQLQVPQEAAGRNYQAEFDAAQKASLDTYQEAEAQLTEVIEGSRSGDLATDAARAGHLMQLVRLYAQAQIDPQAAPGLFASARRLAAQGEQVNVPVDSLPTFIQDALELRAPATTAPATRGAGATPPAGAGTAPAPATPPTPAPGTGDAPAPAPGSDGAAPAPDAGAAAPAPAAEGADANDAKAGDGAGQ
jgi:hypothetical protein